MTVRVAVDAMGGNRAPGAVVRGIADAVESDPDLEVLLVGDSATVSVKPDSIAGLSLHRGRIHLVHASQVVEMGESPVEALKNKKDSSLVRMVSLAAGRGRRTRCSAPATRARARRRAS